MFYISTKRDPQFFFKFTDINKSKINTESFPGNPVCTFVLKLLAIKNGKANDKLCNLIVSLFPVRMIL